MTFFGISSYKHRHGKRPVKPQSEATQRLIYRKNTLIALLKDGKTAAEAAEVMGMSYTALVSFAQRHGINITSLRGKS